MDTSGLKKIDEYRWELPRKGSMNVPGLLFADFGLLGEMDDKVLEQMTNVATLPGIVKASMAMPDAHWGYGFPIGGVAAFDPDEGGVISAGGVGFDISCGVRTLLTFVSEDEARSRQKELADALFRAVPAGLGSRGDIRLGAKEMDAMLRGGAKWAVAQGYGSKRDLEYTEELGVMSGALPDKVSDKAKERQREEMGTLGSGNHYLEVQGIAEVYDRAAAEAFGLRQGECVISIHCGSRGLGHQIGTEYMREMAIAASRHGIGLADRELACAPLSSRTGQDYLGAMRAAINCALANRQIITELVRRGIEEVFPGADLPVLYDVSHNTCKEERHEVGGRKKRLFVHRKGATRALGPGHPLVPERYREAGQPVIIGGSMGTSSYILAGTTEGMELSFGSACHGAGRVMSRKQATKRWRGHDLVQQLQDQGIAIRGHSLRGLAEEAPGAYKDVSAVVEASERSGLARKVARLFPIVCVKG
jgi:tRNA-splicing ligase RtcB (3'-phosphate/5'-hydroxy nucleic acid ligase)